MVNDHLIDCFRYRDAPARRRWAPARGLRWVTRESLKSSGRSKSHGGPSTDSRSATRRTGSGGEKVVLFSPWPEHLCVRPCLGRADKQFEVLAIDLLASGAPRRAMIFRAAEDGRSSSRRRSTRSGSRRSTPLDLTSDRRRSSLPRSRSKLFRSHRRCRRLDVPLL
jgi:hypothetical protein